LIFELNDSDLFGGGLVHDGSLRHISTGYLYQFVQHVSPIEENTINDINAEQ